MKILAIFSVIVAAASFALGVLSRYYMRPVLLFPGGVQSAAFLRFTDTCLLAAIVFLLYSVARQKK